MYSLQLFKEKSRAPETIATALSKHWTWLDISMRCWWSVTMETDTYHSGCLMHPLAEAERFHTRQSRIKVETTPEVHAGPAEQRGCGTRINGWMDGLTGDNRLSEKSKSAGEWRGGGERSGSRRKNEAISLWADERLTGVLPELSVIEVNLSSTMKYWQECRRDAVSSLQILYPRQQNHVNHDPCH